eukprot:TRINITY_DN7988_c0_g1_i3.p1 TRINITY_DN7988_c0_g1~~TRINITY_DN7988_c0_g1_i3.p1  ORF type:complete len:443 (-),score=106.72 TRINITY_DN7988_c0_g1_i3:200-1528(-)
MEIGTAFDTLQSEFRRYERDRVQWDRERSELLKRVAKLEAENRSFVALKTDLIRRIKMLELALRQERQQSSGSQTPAEPLVRAVRTQPPVSLPPIKKQPRSKQLMLQYLEELRYSGQLLSATLSAQGAAPVPSVSVIPLAEAASSVNFSRLHTPAAEGSAAPPATMAMMRAATAGPDLPAERRTSLGSLSAFSSSQRPGQSADAPALSLSLAGRPASVASEGSGFSLPDVGKTKVGKHIQAYEQQAHHKAEATTATATTPKASGASSHASEKRKPGALGELSDLKIDEGGSVGESKSSERERDESGGGGGGGVSVWQTKMVVHNHLDCVRAVAFHYAEPLLLSASDDGTIKLWNLRVVASPDAKSSSDIEPVTTFHAHTGSVYTLAVVPHSLTLSSGAAPSDSVQVFNLNRCAECLGAPLSTRNTFATLFLNEKTQTTELRE